MMWDYRWLLCIVVIGSATDGTYSMNEDSRSKNDFPKIRENNASFSSHSNLDQKRKSHDEPSVKREDEILDSNSAGTATANVAANLMNSNVTVALDASADNGAPSSMNAAKLGFQVQSHPNRDFRHSKIYRKEARAKLRTGLVKSNVASGNLITFNTDHLLVPTQDRFHNPGHNNDSIRQLESTPRTSNTGPSKTTHSDSISKTSTRSLFKSGSKDASDGKFDKLSSGVTVSSGSTESWDNSSSSFSSESESVIDEKSSSVELMTFSFHSAGEARQSTSPSEAMKRVQNLTASPSIAIDNSLARTRVSVQASDRSINKSTSTSDDIAHGVIDRGQSIPSAKNDADDDVTIYSIHTEESRGAERTLNKVPTTMKRDNITQDDSVILVSVTSELSWSRNSKEIGSKRLGETNDLSNSTNLKNNSSHSRPNVDGYSWISINSSTNRISVTEVIDTLKNVDSQESRGSYSYSNSTPSQNIQMASGSKIQITDTNGVSSRRSRSLGMPNVAQSPREFRQSMSGDPEDRLSDDSFTSPVSASTKKIENTSKLIVSSNIQAIGKTGIKSNFFVGNVELPGLSTSANLSPRNKASNQRVAEIKDEPFRLVLDLDSSSSRCSSDSSTERLQNVERIRQENPFYQRRSSEMTLSVSGNSITEPEQCSGVTRRWLIQTSLSPTREPERPIKALVSTESPEVLYPGNKSHKTEAGSVEVSQSGINEHLGGQSSVSSESVLSENSELVVRESPTSEEAVVSFETEATTPGYFFTAFPDLEEHCNASSFNVFIPFINSRESNAIAKYRAAPSLANRKSKNLTSTEDSLYIMEGFGFLKNNADEVPELEEEFDRRREVSFDYGETEIYPRYPQLDDHLLAVKLLDEVESESELPVKQESLIVAGLQWKENIGDRNDDSWWLNDGSNRRREQGIQKKDDDEERTLPISNGFSTSKEARAIPSLSDKVLPDTADSNIKNYRIIFLPTIYVFIGVCVLFMGCSIWCGKISVKRQPILPELTYFIQKKQGATENVV